MAHGIKHGNLFVPNTSGNDVEKQGVACIDGKVIFPITSLSPNPNIPFT